MNRKVYNIVALSFITFFGIPLSILADTELSLELPCAVAIQMTCEHFDYGDGARTGNYDVVKLDGLTYCQVSNPDNSAVCIFDTYECPRPQPVGVDPHDIPNVAICTGCGGINTAVYTSISEAKCCILFGTFTNPSTGLPVC